MTKYIYFIRTKDATRFKIGKVTGSLQSRYAGLLERYGPIFDLESSFYMMLPKSADLSTEERAFHRTFADFQADAGDSEVFHIEAFNECIERAAAIRTQRSKDDDSWTVHSTADYFKLRRSRIAERLIQKLIGLGHEHLAQHMPQFTKEYAGKESKTVWLPHGTRRHFKRLGKSKAGGFSSAEAHFSRAINDYIEQMMKPSRATEWLDLLLIQYAKKVRTRKAETEAVTFKLPVAFEKSLQQMMLDERDGLKTEQSHITRALWTYLCQGNWSSILQSELIECLVADVEGGNSG